MTQPPPNRRQVEQGELDRQLLALVVAQPRRMLMLAIATGMAIGQELGRRGSSRELARLGDNEALCDRACDLVLQQWARSARAGELSETEFQALVAGVIAIARSS